MDQAKSGKEEMAARIRDNQKDKHFMKDLQKSLVVPTGEKPLFQSSTILQTQNTEEVATLIEKYIQE